MARMPASGPVTSEWGPREAPTEGASTFHRGLDIIGDGNWAPEHGILADYGYAGGYGWLATILGGSGYWHRLGHCRDSSPLVPVGRPVGEGVRVAIPGATGTATGVHVHWEVCMPGPTPGEQVNPRDWLAAMAAVDGGTPPAPTRKKDPMSSILVRLADSGDVLIWNLDRNTEQRVPNTPDYAQLQKVLDVAQYDTRAQFDTVKNKYGPAMTTPVGGTGGGSNADVLAAIGALDKQSDTYQAQLLTAIGGVDEATLKTFGLERIK